MSAREKHIEFARAGLELVSPPLSRTFAHMAEAQQEAGAELERTTQDRPAEKARFEENEQLMSGGSIEGLTARGDQWARYNQEVRERAGAGGKKDGGVDFAFLELIEQIEQINRDLDQLRIEIESAEAEFEAEFGADWRDDLAKMYLDEETLAKLDGLTGQARNDAIIQALSDKMLNADGSIKDEYKGNDVAEYLEKVHRERTIEGLVNDAQQAIDSGDPDIVRETLKNVKSEMAQTVADQAVGRQANGQLVSSFNEQSLDLAKKQALTSAHETKVSADTNALDTMNDLDSLL